MCAFELSPARGHDQAVTGVRIDGDDFPQVDDCDSEEGWQIAGAEITLCGAA